MKYLDSGNATTGRRARQLAPLALVLALAACGGSKEPKPGQSLVRVNGDEVTVMQLNEELQRANVPAANQDAASKQLLESLIDRQLLLAEAAKEKLDRDPKVAQSIERAKALILAQAYLQKRVGAPVRPSAAEVADYYAKNPQFFAERKQFDLRQLVLPSASLDAAAQAELDKSKSLDAFAAWLDARQIKYARAEASRSSSDLPAAMAGKLAGMSKGQLFIVREGERSLVVALADVKDAPLSAEVAAPQIEQFLLNKKNKEQAEAELKRLRAAAKIEYLNQSKSPAAPGTPADKAADGAAARGVAGLK